MSGNDSTRHPVGDPFRTQHPLRPDIAGGRWSGRVGVRVLLASGHGRRWDNRSGEGLALPQGGRERFGEVARDVAGELLRNGSRFAEPPEEPALTTGSPVDDRQPLMRRGRTSVGALTRRRHHLVGKVYFT